MKNGLDSNTVSQFMLLPERGGDERCQWQKKRIESPVNNGVQQTSGCCTTIVNCGKEWIP